MAVILFAAIPCDRGSVIALAAPVPAVKSPPAAASPAPKPGMRFIQTTKGVFREEAGKDLLVLFSYVQPGFFVGAFNSPVDFSTLDPSHLDKESGAFIFVRYSQEENRYVEVLIGKDRYQLNDQAAFLFERTSGNQPVRRIDIDNTRPYASISTQKGENDAAILGIVGLEAVVNSGASNLGLLSATPDRQYAGVYEPYEVTPSGLQFRGRPVNSTRLGFGFAAPKNRCLNRDALYLTSFDFRRLRSTRDQKARIDYLKRLVRKQTAESVLAELFPIRIHSDRIVALDPTGIRLIQPLPTRELPIQLCSLTEVSP